MKTRIQNELKDAMRQKDEVRVGTLRLVMACIKDREIALRGDTDQSETLSDQETHLLLAKMLKQREESARTYEQAGRMDMAGREQAEIKIIREFMPKPMSEDEVNTAIAKAIQKTGATSIRDMGKVMAALKAAHAGRMDFGAAGKSVKAALG